MTKLEILMDEYEQLQSLLKCLKDRNDELKCRIQEEMEENNIDSFDNNRVAIKLSSEMRYVIPRSETTNVYELLKSNGYDCSVYNSTMRTRYLNQILEENEVLPEWLLGKVDIVEKKRLIIEEID